jgi:hypothetical protein
MSSRKNVTAGDKGIRLLEPSCSPGRRHGLLICERGGILIQHATFMAATVLLSVVSLSPSQTLRAGSESVDLEGLLVEAELFPKDGRILRKNMVGTNVHALGIRVILRGYKYAYG